MTAILLWWAFGGERKRHGWILPLVFAFGAGAASRQEIGVSVLGGVIFGTILVLVFIPFMYVLIRSVFQVNRS